MICKDPTLAYLAKFGFNVIRLPREGLHPGGVLAGNGPQLEYIGEISDYWINTPKPKPKPPKEASIVTGRTIGEFDGKVGLELLGTILKAVNLKVPSLDAGIKGAKSFTFALGKPEIWSLPPVDLGAYLGQGHLVEKNPVANLYFGPGKPVVYIITDLLTSPDLTVEVAKSGDRDLDIDIDALQKAVDCKVNLESKSETGTKISFSGDKRLAFGFRAIRAQVQADGWELTGFPKPGQSFFAEPPPPAVWAAAFELGEAEIRA